MPVGGTTMLTICITVCRRRPSRRALPEYSDPFLISYEQFITVCLHFRMPTAVCQTHVHCPFNLVEVEGFRY